MYFPAMVPMACLLDSKVEGDEEMEDEDDDSYAEFEDAEYWKQKQVTPNTNRKHQKTKADRNL